MRLEWHHKHDPTYLSYVEARVSSIIHKLHGLRDSDIPSHISVEELHRFKRLYNALGFHCRYLICNAVFPTEEQRQQHESTHIRWYKCLDCDFSARGFTSCVKLRKHREKYHMVPEDFDTPLQVLNTAALARSPSRSSGVLDFAAPDPLAVLAAPDPRGVPDPLAVLNSPFSPKKITRQALLDRKSFPEFGKAPTVRGPYAKTDGHMPLARHVSPLATPAQPQSDSNAAPSMNLNEPFKVRVVCISIGAI